VGFEVRVEAVTGGDELWIQLTRGQAEALDLDVDQTLWLRATSDASAVG
jgi:hypothetical protein